MVGGRIQDARRAPRFPPYAAALSTSWSLPARVS